MGRTSKQLRDDALAIWQSGVDAVRSDQLVRDNVRVEGARLFLGESELSLPDIQRIAIVGAGKAGAGMVLGLEEALGDQVLRDKQVFGWLNVPDDCLSQTPKCVRLHGARPAGLNEPTPEGVHGTRQILRTVQSLGENDLCVCLLSGGGSALMPAPIDHVSLEDKQTITRLLSGGGANIQQLNTVRKRLSRVKGGGLLRACRAGRLVTLIISDVIGDPLDVIASGPTVTDTTTRQEALDVLRQFELMQNKTVARICELLVEQAKQPDNISLQSCQAAHYVIGNNASAVNAAAEKARELGYRARTDAATRLEGEAEHTGRQLARAAVDLTRRGPTDCLISGGEPVVRLVPPELRGKGGRNQQLALAALIELLHLRRPNSPLKDISLLSGGTDGEDGPTDAAGAVIDQHVFQQMTDKGIDPRPFLDRNDAYHFFEATDGLIKTGPTHTNVCDLRIVTSDPPGPNSEKKDH